MAIRYRDIYPTEPLVRSADKVRREAAELISLEYFEAEPATMPRRVFAEHHILLNLNPNSHRVENWRDGEHRDFIYEENEVIVTPAGVESGWRWHARSRVIVVTLDPEALRRFAQREINLALTEQQLRDEPQFVDADLVQAGKMLLDALKAGGAGSSVVFEALARVFLVKLLQRYGEERASGKFSGGFTVAQYDRVSRYVAKHFGERVTLDDLAAQAALSPYHFSRVFKKAVGQTPHQFLTAYRIERAKSFLADPEETMSEIALNCGFADQAHFTRTFKRSTGHTPLKWRARQQS